MKANYFIASDGLKIGFVPGWYEVKHAWPYNIKDFNEFAEKCFSSYPTYPTSWAFFVNKLVTFNYFREILNETLMGREKWPKALDIGTGPGIQPRLLKAAGMCDEAWGIDILDRRNEFSDDQCLEYLGRVDTAYLSKDSKALQEMAKLIDENNSRLGDWYPFPAVTTLFNLNRPCGLDKYIVGDFMSLDPGSTRFDLVTGISCIEALPIRDLLKKVYSLLNKNGVFFVIVINWHEVTGGSMHLPMDAPWLHSRLSREDLLRYYREIRPEISKAAEKCIYSKDSHMTPFDYRDAASENGMRLMTYKRSLLPSKDLISTFNRNDHDLFSYFYKQVMPQAKKINPYFSVPDAFTYYLTMVFIRE